MQIGKLLARTIARRSSRIFRGTKLSHHEEWTNTMIDFTTNSFMAAQRLKDSLACLKPVARYFIPEVAKIFKHFALAEELIIPFLSDRDQGQKPSMDLLLLMLDDAERRSMYVLSGSISRLHLPPFTPVPWQCPTSFVTSVPCPSTSILSVRRSAQLSPKKNGPSKMASRKMKRTA